MTMLLWILLLPRFISCYLINEVEIKESTTPEPDVSINIIKNARGHELENEHMKYIKQKLFQTVEDRAVGMAEKFKNDINAESSDYADYNAMSTNVINDIDIVNDTKSQVITEGKYKLKCLGKKIKQKLLINKNISSIQADISNNYLNAMNVYFNTVKLPTLKSTIEREYFVSDIIESANAIFANQCNKLFFRIIDQIKGLQESQVKFVSKEVRKMITNEKKSNYKFTCEKFSVCKIFPAYSDRVADLFKEMVNLTDVQLIDFGLMLKQTVEEHYHFFNAIVHPDTTSVIDSKVQSLIGDLPALRDYFNTIAHFISQRYRKYEIEDDELTIKTKAMRVLIEMIDKAFGMLGEHFIEKRFDKIFRDFKDMVKDFETVEIKTALNNFVTIFKYVVGFYWEQQSLDEVKILTKVIVFGRTSDDGTAIEELLNEGSKFVRGKSVYSNLEKLFLLIDNDG